jgi:uncharacterized protein (AIM24 family)
MDMHETHTKHQIGPRRGLALRDARGRTVKCVSGSVWLTMEGDRRDVVLNPGASFVVDRDGLTLLAAQQPSAVQVSVQNRTNHWWDRVVDFLDRTYGPGAIRPSRRWMY